VRLEGVMWEVVRKEPGWAWHDLLRFRFRVHNAVQCRFNLS
jgi:hypothetical protein